jgi:hypothetical protein
VTEQNSRLGSWKGQVVKRTGDGVLIEFRSVVDAVRCAIEVQNGMVERNAGLPPERRIEFRVASMSAITGWQGALRTMTTVRSLTSGRRYERRSPLLCAIPSSGASVRG